VRRKISKNWSLDSRRSTVRNRSNIRTVLTVLYTMLHAGPLDVPTNFRIRPDTKNSTYAEFLWDEVDTSVERVRGFFRGYRVTLYRVGQKSKLL